MTSPVDPSMPTVVAIVCPGHSGSTLLELVLGAHSGIVSGGELKMLGAANRGRVSIEKRSCTCGGGPPPRCAFWSDVDRSVRAGGAEGLEALDPEHEDEGRFARDNSILYAALAAASGCSMVVDSSKSLARFERLLRIPGLRLRPIRLLRRPHGVVASYLRSGRPWLPWARHYTRHMLRSREILAGVDHFVVRYEALATAPRPTLEALMSWLGVPFEGSQLDWPPLVQHSVGGNAMRFDPRREIRLDVRWKRELSLVQRAGITWMTLPARFRSRWAYDAAKPFWDLAAVDRAQTSSGGTGARRKESGTHTAPPSAGQRHPAADQAASDPPPLSVVLILSCPHSGSTLLDLLLGSHSEVVSAGELKALRPSRPGDRRKRSKLDNRCACGIRPARSCPFWTAVDEELRRESLTLDQIVLETRRDQDFAAHNRALLRAVAEVGHARFVVDSSKSLPRARRLQRLEELDLRFILLVRDPRGVAFSGMRKGRRWWAEAFEYVRFHWIARSLLRGTDHLVVRYETLATSPEQTMRRVMTWLGVEYEEAQLRWREHDHHNFAGNRLRYSTSSDIRLDDRWRRELSPLRRFLVAGIAAPARVLLALPTRGRPAGQNPQSARPRGPR